MRLLKITILVQLAAWAFASSAWACTSFALYGREVFYGMNFDFMFVPLKFWIESAHQMKIFHMAFLYDDYVKEAGSSGFFANTCGMNTKGLFCACQEVRPTIDGCDASGPGEMHMGDQYSAVSRFSTVDEVKTHIGGKIAVQYIGPSLHNLFADKSGNAFVSETDNHQNLFTDIRGDYIVMTNFGNHTLKGNAYKKAEGAGADRYRIACEFLSGNRDCFTVEKGFQLLRDAWCGEEDYPTYCSMIFHPGTNTVYIALKFNMGRIWKVSIHRQTVETVKGHARYQRVGIGKEGILLNELASVGE